MDDKYSILTKFNIICVLVSVLVLTTLIVDYYYIKEFKTESVFLLTCVIILVFNVIRHSNQKLWRKLLLGLLSNIMIEALLVFGFYILTLSLFGYGFTGRDVQTIWIVMAISNILLFILTFIDIRYLLLKKRKGGGI